MTAAAQALQPGGGGVVPFWAASQEQIFDNFTSDNFTPAASIKNLFQGSLADIKVAGYLKQLWLKFVGTGGSTGGTFNADGPMNALTIFRFIDPNGHAIIDADSFGLYLLNKYGCREWIGDPKLLPGSNFSLGGTTGTDTPQFDLLVPFPVNSELGLGALSDMDASGPYQIIAQGAPLTSSGSQQGIYQTAPTTTTPLLTIGVGGEFYSLPGPQSRVSGQPQIQYPPLLDRGLAVVNEFTKVTFTGIQQGVNPSLKIRRVGNIISQIYLVARDTNGARIGWTAANTLASGSRVQLNYDNVPLWDVDPQHIIDQMMRRRAGGLTYDTGVLLFDRRSPADIAFTNIGVDGGLDDMLQTAQTTALELTVNAGSALKSIDCYTSDVTITNMVTGEKYAFAYGGQLLLPSPPGSIRS